MPVQPFARHAKYPGLSRELVEALDKAFPERCPDPATPERQIWMDAGRRSVVRSLWKALEEQENAQLQ